MTGAVVEILCRLRRGAFELGIDARLERRTTGVFGPSGSGKTSLFLALAGLVEADELRLAVDGEVLVDSRAGLVPPPHRRRVGMMFQEHRLFPHRSVEANLRYGAPRTGDGPAFDEVVELLDLAPLLARRPAACSGGERQRAALGRALLGAPRLLLLDEPLASLDRGLKRQILPYLRRARDRFALPVLVVSHDLGDLLALTDDVLLLEHGRVAGRGTVGELTREARTLELLHDQGLVFALPGVVGRRDADGLAWVALDGPGGVELACGDCRDAVGAPVEVLLRPEDVVLARGELEARTSLSNRLPGRVASLTRTEERVLVALDCGLAVPLLAEVTDRAVRNLGLSPGEAVVALCKAQATRTRGLEPDLEPAP